MYEAAPHNLSLYSFSWKTMQDSKYSYIMQSAPPKLLFPSTQIMLISMYDMNHDILYIGMISKCYSLRTTESILCPGIDFNLVDALMLSMLKKKFFLLCCLRCAHILRYGLQQGRKSLTTQTRTKGIEYLCCMLKCQIVQ